MHGPTQTTLVGVDLIHAAWSGKCSDPTMFQEPANVRLFRNPELLIRPLEDDPAVMQHDDFGIDEAECVALIFDSCLLAPCRDNEF